MNYPVFAEKEKFEVVTRFYFLAGNTNQVLGVYVGNINDQEFAKKLDRVRGRLWLNNVNYNQSMSSGYVKEIKRLNDQERFNRKMSKVWNEFVKRQDLLTGLFRENELKALCDDYKKTVLVLKERYLLH